MPYFEHDNVHLFYLVEGYGKAVLLLHGWTCDMHDWSFQIPMLVTRGFTTITLDMRGHGRSTLPANNDYSPATLAADAAALLHHLGVPNALIVGHTTGAVVASALASNTTLGVTTRGLVLVDPGYYLSARERTNLVEGLQNPNSPELAASLFARALYTHDSPAFLKAWHMRRARCTPADAVSHTLRGVFGGPDGLGLWENIQLVGPTRAGPRLVVCVSESHAALERSLGLADPRDRVEVVTASAWPHQQASERFNALLADWLDACDFYG